MFPYKLQNSLEMRNENGTIHLAFAEFCRTQLSTSRSFLKLLALSDECKFSLTGSVKNKNCRIWGTERPDQVHETLQLSPYVMVWCAVTKYEIIAPLFFENENETQHSSKRMLRYHAFPRMRNYLQNTLFQQNDATSPLRPIWRLNI